MIMNNNPRQIGEYVTATDPMREQMAASYAVVPGGPQNNNPANAMSISPGPQTFGSAYGDLKFNPPQLQAVMPAPVSQMPQQQVVGQGMNRNTAFIPQPPPQAGDQMEGGRLSAEAQGRGLNPSMMGMIGMSVDMRQPLPGGSVPSPQQAPNTMPLSTPSPEAMAQQNAQMSTMNRGARTPGGMRT